MKKIFYFIASAIVALGAVACQNEVDENITPGTQNDVVSFTVSFDDNTRIALDTVENGEASFVFEGNETLYLDYNSNTFEFTNTIENPYTFTGEGEGLSEIFNNNYYVTITNKTGDDLQVASRAYETFGEAAYFRFYGSINGDVNLSLNNYVIHCTTGADDVTLYCDKYDGGDDIAPESLVLPANGEYWINLENAYASEINVSYKINDTTVKEATLDAKVNGAYGYKIFNLGTLSAAVAMVDGVNYTDLSKALTAAGTTKVITLLANATDVATACVINANGYDLTTGDGFLALKNYNNANGYYDVVAVTNDVQWHVVGSHLDDNQWDVVNRNTPMYKITGTNLVVAGNVDLKANNELKFVDGTTWQSTSVGAPSTSNIDATTWFHAGGDNIKVAADGTYNLYYDTENQVIIVANIESAIPELTFKTYYLNTGGSSLWNQAGAWFAGHFWTGSAARDYEMVASGEDNIFKIEVPIGFTDVIFIRMGSEATDFSNMWTSGNNGYWNKTNNLTISGDKNCYTITAWGQDTDVCSGAWSTK